MTLTEAIGQFLYEESAALDEARYSDWLALLADDFRYEVPQPITPQSPDEEQYSSRMPISRESKGSLRMRFDRVSSEYAWSDRPRHFLRHFVSNIRVRPLGPDEWEVRSNVLVARSRSSEESTLATAGRVDVLRGDPERGFLLAARTVHLDVEVPSAGQLIPVY
ncbi:aromatic-ring-hydroxylating dioxygenase subunit beta [Embleya scabrispora]|uniref:aromatic-ring-hydroxylating dioxygenase subunit beta n=1 Tax=Embleya scabrispora TaxID=159449 RepID=UPI000380EC3C|nr:aromatic-ring-hydroxylating dioxygenase subunit beta [Embleya scabrispora]MYS80738.1 aromatic-ring-hydroxylating dioxygenase subunit beta [Streptomyces sp. SID5474]